MVLQNQLATCLNYLRSKLLALPRLLGISRSHSDDFFTAVELGPAALLMLSNQLFPDNQFFYDGAADHDCAVCLTTFKDGDHFPLLPCRHVFHGWCFDGWLNEYKFNCPLCRFPLFSNEQVRLAERRLGSLLNILDHPVMDIGKGSAGSIEKGGGAVGGESNVTKPKENVTGNNSVMKVPGGDGSYISREEFEKNPQGYFAGFHAEQKNNN